MFRYLFLFCCFAGLSCNTLVKELYLNSESINSWLESEWIRTAKCSDQINYQPDSNALIIEKRILRVNLHFMNSADSTSNFNGYAAQKYGKELIYHANRKLVYNKKMSLPEGNKTPVLNPNITYKLTGIDSIPDDSGIYVHYDDSLFYYVNEGKRNNYKRDVIKKYAIGEDSILNIFYMPHHPDSVASSTYSASGSGIALGKSIKLGIQFDPETKPWYHASLLNHEVGHVLGLRHTWNLNDGCDDTPRHPNCWARTEKEPCNQLVSNNMMDYNSNQHAITPCQIGKMRANLGRLGSRQRDLLVKSWCALNSEKDIIVNKDYHITGSRDLEGNLIILPGVQLTISCRISMPSGSEIIVHPGANLILDGCRLYNDCGNKWKGIKILQKGKKTGKVFYNSIPIIENTEIPLNLKFD